MNKILRLIDANLNRSHEALRVCEDIARFMLNDKGITRSFKALRHRVSALGKRIESKQGLVLLKARNVKKDIGKVTIYSEKRRKNIKDVFRANTARAKESLRVLEEVTKLFDRKGSGRFKRIRFRVYELEKKSRLKLDIILHN